METTNLLNRKGKVIIDQKIIFEMLSNEKAIKAFFSEFYPIHATETFFYNTRNQIEYWGVSPLFRELTEGEKIPTYDLVFRQEGIDSDIKIIKAEEVI